ncbi:hypothetical protein POM88_015336 [Heracleum sosnowskyi]|uniref:Uncharacterized protein n=1 Tax=Heracleum sosnowskyi TaxID=360622 RepID=A0AAD8IL68_9APIA|nr:hypothetical protein POM88_015336 [Heracleum sosnowskyi]
MSKRIVQLSEKDLGEAVAEAVECGIIKSRDELFITSKLWCSDAHPDRVLPALQNSLSHGGVSDTRSHETLAEIPPSVNQVEMNLLWHQKKLREFCKENNILPSGRQRDILGN